MNFKSYRLKNNLDHATTVRKLRPHLKGFGLDEELLERFEKGEVKDDRHQAILLAAQRAFPDFSPSSTENASVKRTRKKSMKIFLIAGLTILLLVSFLVFYNYRNDPFIDDVSRYIGMLSALAAVCGFLISIINSNWK